MSKHFSWFYDILSPSLTLCFCFTEEFDFVLDLENKESIWEFGPALNNCQINVSDWKPFSFFCNKKFLDLTLVFWSQAHLYNIVRLTG